MESKPSFFNRNNILLLVGGLMVGVILGAIILLSDGLFISKSRSTPPVVGQALADFSLADTNGNKITMSELKGQPVVVNFWATWCKPCENEMPLLNKAAGDLNGKVTFLGVNAGEEKSAVLDYEARKGLDFPILVDETGSVVTQFLITGYPTTLFVDAQGVVQAIRIGELDAGMLSGFLKQIGVKR